MGLFVEGFQGSEQLIELLGGKAGEVVEVLGLAAKFLYAKHSRAVVCPYLLYYATGLMSVSSDSPVSGAKAAI